MRSLQADVVVIGGGATGAGVVRDAAMRGYSAVLVERVDLGQGTTGRFHGLLHSGGRYIASDPVSAAECARENQVLRRIMPHTIEDTGGLFVQTRHDPDDYADRFLARARAAGVPASEVSVGEVLRREPRLDPGIRRAFEVADGSIDGWGLVWGCAESARAHGARILTYHWVTAIEVRDGAVSSVVCRADRDGGEQVRIECRFVINCAGAWAGEVAALAGVEGVEVVPGAGIMIAMNHRLTHTVINRCQYPGDGDILVPAHQVSIIGTTDRRGEHPDRLTIDPDEVQQMLDSGEVLIPGFRRVRALHAWVGARPLIRDTRVGDEDTRHMSRGMAILDHSARDHLSGMLTLAGGKLTTFRLMAERVVDAMCAQLGEQRPCRTASEPVPGTRDGTLHTLGSRWADRQDRWGGDHLVCECELVTRTMITDELAARPDASLDDLRRRLRLGMGPCQGGFCGPRAAALLLGTGPADADRATGALATFLANRWIGIAPVHFGDTVRQTALDAWLVQSTLDLDHVPRGGAVRKGETDG